MVRQFSLNRATYLAVAHYGMATLCVYTNQHVTEEKVVIRLAQRDPEAFARIYKDNYQKIFQYALKRTGNTQVAQDITSETFFKALRKLWQFRWRNVSFSSWLYRIATNEANQYFRKRRYTAASLEELQQSGFEPVSESSPLSEVIAAQERLEQHSDFLACQKIISQMDIKYQEVLCLRFLERYGKVEVMRSFSLSRANPAAGHAIRASKLAHSDKGIVLRHSGGMNRARASRQKELSTKMTNHHWRHRSSVRRSIPKPSRRRWTRSASSRYTC